MKIDPNFNIKTPRLYIKDDLNASIDLILNPDQSHYIANVMRLKMDDHIRVFNGKDGEYLCVVTKISKKQVLIKSIKCLRSQPSQSYNIHLYCPLIKKDRFAWMIEKAIELGATHIHPFTSDRTQLSKFNHDKTQKHIIEASEQCERLDIACLSDLTSFHNLNFVHPTYCAMERQDNAIFAPNTNDTAPMGVIIGPEGGWSDNEVTFLSDHNAIIPTSLGDNILRAETAALFMLSRIGK